MTRVEDLEIFYRKKLGVLWISLYSFMSCYSIRKLGLSIGNSLVRNFLIRNMEIFSNNKNKIVISFNWNSTLLKIIGSIYLEKS